MTDRTRHPHARSRDDGVRGAVLPALAGGLLATLALAAAPLVASAQAPPFLVNQETRVSSVDFRFPGERSLETGLLRRQLALEGPGLGYRVKSVLDVLPFISAGELERFDPPALLRDRVRLTRFYRNAGFPHPSVDYEVALDTTDNTVDVTWVIRQGNPVVLDTVEVQASGGQPLEETLPDGLGRGWRSLERELAQTRGQRLGSALRARIGDRVIHWLRDRGYPDPSVSADTLTEEAGTRLRLTVDPGGRMRVGAVRVEGNERLSDEVIRREVPLQEGDWFSRARLAEGQSELFGLDMVRIAVTETERDTVRDDRVDVRVRVTEGALHLLSGRAGYGTAAGVSADASWSHRDFLGGARTLEVSALAETGILTSQATRARRYGLSVNVRQPWLFDHRVEGVFRPFVEYRDDLRDESVEFGAEATALYRRGPRRNVSLRYSLTSRRVIQAGPGALLGEDADLLGVLSGLDTLDLDRRVSSLSAVGRWAPAPGRELGERGLRSDWSLFGSVEVAAPPGLTTVEYGKAVVEASGLLPLGAGVAVRGTLGGGRVLPFGVSVPAPDGSDRLESYLRLRDAVLTAGGARDVRGWGAELLGPKAPDLQRTEDGAVAAARYIPLGGLARWTGSVQVEVPLPLVGRPHGLHAFLDAGRVWTPDGRFLPTDGPLLPGQLGEKVRVGTGVGVSVSTPVGPVQIDVGYKVNPSLLDLRDPAEVGRALLDDRPVEEVPEDSMRRWHLHLSIGGVS